MPVRESAPLGAPIWIDLTTSDLDAAQEFYGAVFGWTFESYGPGYHGYLNALCDGRPVAGMMANDPQWDMPDGWTVYLHTADIRATLAQAAAAGAVLCAEGGAEPMEIKDKGWMSVFVDPAGALVGLWQPGGHRGFEVVEEAGAPAYHQLTARDYGAALQFYRDVFGWQTETVSDTDEFRYSTALFDGEALLGVMDGSVLPEQTASEWSVFLATDDVDKTVDLIVERGGSVLRAAEDTPYGRLAAVADPTGAGFNLTSLADR